MIPRNSYSSTWCSPKCLTDFARWYMGDIDVDPCSPPMEIRRSPWHTVDAAYGIDRDGLNKGWDYANTPSRVYINHPGGRGALYQWWAKLKKEVIGNRVRSFVWVAFNTEQLRHIAATDHVFLLECQIWLPEKRVRYLEQDTGQAGQAPRYATALICSGGLASASSQSSVTLDGMNFIRIK